MVSYRLTNAADADLDRLFVFGITTFGLEQAEHYVAGLLERFDELTASPQLWQAVDHVRAGLRRCVYGSHSIYYRIAQDEIVIVRILGKEDRETSL